MRSAWSQAVRVFVVAMAGLAALPAAAADDVSFAFDWIYNGSHAGYFVAREKGYYKDAGLNVTLSRGSGSGDTVKRVGTGAATFGVADTSVVVSARANEEIPVRIVAMAYGKSPLGIIYLKESGIKTPKDLVGKTIGRTASGSSVTMWPAFLAANGIDRASVKETVADANALLPLLLSRRIDAVLGQQRERVLDARRCEVAEDRRLHDAYLPAMTGCFGRKRGSNTSATVTLRLSLSAPSTESMVACMRFSDA
jgi:NitT/TauT family transport system substrate-binding protein